MLSFRDAAGIFNYRAAGVLVDSRSVLVHQAPGENFWSLPGGRGEFGEPSADTIRREFREEIGLDVEVQRLLWVVEYFFRAQEPFHEIAFYYQVRSIGSPPTDRVFSGRTEDRDPPLTFRWVLLEDLPNLRLYPGFLSDALRPLPDRITHIVYRD